MIQMKKIYIFATTYIFNYITLLYLKNNKQMTPKTGKNVQKQGYISLITQKEEQQLTRSVLYD
jgi:hypothetical protein